jgi:hypothetical protein
MPLMARVSLVVSHTVHRFAFMSKTATALACFLAWTHGQMSKLAPPPSMMRVRAITLFQCTRLTVTAIRDALVLLIIQP